MAASKETPQTPEGDALGVLLSDAVITAARELSEQQILQADAEYSPFVLRQDGVQVHALEFLARAPHRARGTIDTPNPDSFANLVFAHDPESKARIYYDHTGRMVAVLNDDYPNQPAWRDRTIVLTPAEHESWKAWKSINGKYLDQLSMAEFIEDRLSDFQTPPGADMLELAQKFEVARAGAFLSAARLSNGSTTLTVEETNTGRSQIPIPERVQLGMQVFDEQEAYSFAAWFRYRIKDQKLLLAFKIENIDRIQKQAVTDLVAKLDEKMPNHQFFQGTTKPVTSL
jgi:uncharacterized protein YfdQ (DUF2303 family)